MPATISCPVEGCDSKIERRDTVCRDCWTIAPAAQRRAVQAAFEHWGAIPPDCLPEWRMALHETRLTQFRLIEAVELVNAYRASLEAARDVPGPRVSVLGFVVACGDPHTVGPLSDMRQPDPRLCRKREGLT